MKNKQKQLFFIYKHDNYKRLQKECEKIIIKTYKNAKWTDNLNLIDCL